MTAYVLLHLLTPYPISNPNRDDLGRNKTAMFGDTIRGRISSQAKKRPTRVGASFAALIAAGYAGVRTKKIGDIIVTHLVDEKGAEPDAAKIIAAKIVAALNGAKQEEEDEKGKKGNKGKKGKKTATKADKAAAKPTDVAAEDAADGAVEGAVEGEQGAAETDIDSLVLETSQLVFVSLAEIARMKTIAERLLDGSLPEPKSLGALVREMLTEVAVAADMALFGRMMASHPGFNIEAAAHVAHMFTVNEVVEEIDYFTAQDDLVDRTKTAGSAHLGDAAFVGASIYYSFSVINFDLLVRNLNGDVNLAKQTLRAFITAMMVEGPRGKIATHAQHPRAMYAMVERGEGQPLNLAAAFNQPVRADDMNTAAIERLRDFRQTMYDAYGDAPVKAEFSGIKVDFETVKFDDLLDFAAA